MEKMNGNFCCDTFWDINVTWNANIPDFSTCFQDTVLTFLPCLVFSVVGIIHMYLLSRHPSVNSLPWTWRIILKLLLGVLLFIISVSWCVLYVYKKSTDGNVPVSTLIASFSRSFTYVIIIILMFKHMSHGITTSTILSLFWICFASFGIIMHRSVILKYNSHISPPDWNYILSMVYYPLIYIELFLSLFVDTRKFEYLENGSPLEEAAFLSRITYVWFNRTVYIGFKRLLTVKDFLPLAVKLKSTFTYESFSKNWKFNLSTSELQKQSIYWALLKSFWPWLFTGFILEIIFILTLLLPPVLLDGILEFVDDDQYTWRSYFFCGAIFIVVVINKTLSNNCIMCLLFTGAQVKSALVSAVYRKNLLLASSARKEFNSGGITNLISVDIYRISQFSLYATSLFNAPLRIILIIVVLWQYLGIACLAGVAVIVTLIPISFYMSRVSEKYTDKQMEVKDLRLKYMNEILHGIKILKFYAWELPFSSKVSKTRKDEIKFIRLSQLCYVITSFVFSCAPILVSIATFATYVFMDSRNVLDPTRAFVSLNMLDQLRFALFMIPDSLSELIQTIASLERVKSFLISEEIELDIVGCNPDEGKVVAFKNASLHWSKESSFALQNIDLNVSNRALIAVIGPVGCGKSSLLSAILGEMYKTSGSVDVKGNIAYVPQEAWILNRSLKCNILLEKPVIEDIYNKILDCCCLRPDLEILSGGDKTEIGEKGINLSGGQKQRISLARAVFQNRDIYLLDDPLSAVDAHVRKALFEDVIGNKGLLKNKTRILVTHDISILPFVDTIIRMEEGKILESGTYKDLMESSETFLNFMQTHTGLSELKNLELGVNLSEMAGGDAKVITYQRTISDDFVQQSDIKENKATLIEEEKMEVGSVKRGIYLNYMRHVGWPILILALVGYTSFTLSEAGANIWVADWSADPVENGTMSRTVWRLSVYSGLGLAQALTIVFGVTCMVYGSTKASELYHRQMLDSILKSPMSFFDITPMGRIINRFSTDMDTLDIHIVYDIDGWISCILYSLSTFIVIGINTPIFLATIVPLVVLYLVFMKLHLNTSRQIMRHQSTSRSPIYSHLLESIYGVTSIRAFKVQNEFIEKLEDYLDNHIACYIASGVCNRWLHFCLDCIGAIVVLIATFLGIENRHILGASIVGLIITYALSVTDALMWFIRTNTNLENKSVSIERVDEYCQLSSEAPWQNPNNDPEVTWPENGEIVFDNYSTRYRENLDLVLKEVNLNVNSNEKVGIIGRTGAGKSSVTLALFRIIEPAQGTILIDNVDISKIGLHALRSKLTIIPQDPVLFTGSLRFNLDPNDEYGDDDIWQSLENSHLKEFVSNLSESLQHEIVEGGGNLSAGQKQLLCLSRALLKKSKILVLDEATAAVDMDTDSLVQDTIKSAFANHTVITIAHRLNTVMDYDKIVVMDAGAIVEVGSPRDLLAKKNSHFYEMSQKAGLV